MAERIIEPPRLVQNHRGWEIAGPVELCDQTADPPAGFESLLERQREVTIVRMELSQDARWAADVYAESTSRLRLHDQAI